MANMTTRVLRDALLMDKTADRMATNDGKEPKAEKLHPDEPGRAQTVGTVDAPVGEKPHPNPDEISDSAWYAFLEGKPQLIGKAFDTFEDASKAEKGYVSEHFDTKNYESRRALLRKYAEAGSIPDGSSIAERINHLTK